MVRRCGNDNGTAVAAQHSAARHARTRHGNDNGNFYLAVYNKTKAAVSDQRSQCNRLTVRNAIRPHKTKDTDRKINTGHQDTTDHSRPTKTLHVPTFAMTKIYALLQHDLFALLVLSDPAASSRSNFSDQFFGGSSTRANFKRQEFQGKRNTGGKNTGQEFLVKYSREPPSAPPRNATRVTQLGSTSRLVRCSSG